MPDVVLARSQPLKIFLASARSFLSWILQDHIIAKSTHIIAHLRRSTAIFKRDLDSFLCSPKKAELCVNLCFG